MNGDKYKSPRKNQGWGKQNPFNDELGVQKESDSDQVQNSYHDTGSGWIPFSARDKRPIRISLWDNMEVPGWSDRSQAWGGDANAMGPAPFRNNMDVATYERLIFPAREIKENKRVNPDEENMQDDIDYLTEGRVKGKIIKISSDDTEWMTTTVHQMKSAIPGYTNELNRNFGSKWSYALPPIKDGNTLRFKWKQGSGLDTNYFLLYVRYDAGADTYSVSSSFYDGKTNQESTLQPWSDDIYVDILMDPQIWVRR